MEDELASGIERAVFGAVGRDDIDAWLSRHLHVRLGGDLSHIIFRSGRIAAVYGAELHDSRQVAAKVHRHPRRGQRVVDPQEAVTRQRQDGLVAAHSHASAAPW